MAVTIYTLDGPLVVPNVYGAQGQADAQSYYDRKHGTIYGKRTENMISLFVCDAVLDEICPAWRKDVASGNAEIDFKGKQRYDQAFNKEVDVVPRPLSTTGLQLKRHRGLVREVVITTAQTTSWFGSPATHYPYLTIQPTTKPDHVVIVTLDEAHIAVPGYGKGTTASGLYDDIWGLMKKHTGGYLEVCVGSAKDIKAVLKKLSTP